MGGIHHHVPRLASTSIELETRSWLRPPMIANEVEERIGFVWQSVVFLSVPSRDIFHRRWINSRRQ